MFSEDAQGQVWVWELIMFYEPFTCTINTLIHMPTLARSACSGPGLRTQDQVWVWELIMFYEPFTCTINTLIHMPTLARSACSGPGLKNQDQVWVWELIMFCACTILSTHVFLPPPHLSLSVGLTGPGPGKFVCMFSVITCNGMNSSKMSQWFKILKKNKKIKLINYLIIIN